MMIIISQKIIIIIEVACSRRRWYSLDNDSSASQQILAVYETWKFIYRAHKNPPRGIIVCQMNPVNILKLYLLKELG
jgi:hypothetical protein